MSDIPFIQQENGNKITSSDELGRKTTVTEETEGIDFRSFLSDVLQVVNIRDAIKNIELCTEHVLHIPLEYQKKLAEGSLQFLKSKKNGEFFGTLYSYDVNSKPKFVHNCTFVERGYIGNNPLDRIASSVFAIQTRRQLNELDRKLSDVLEIVQEIRMGQHNDRVAGLVSGRKLMLKAINMKADQKILELSNARASMSESREQLFKELETQINSFKPLYYGMRGIIKNFFKELFDSNYLIKKDQEVSEIQDLFNLYLQATTAIAFSYYLSDYPSEAIDTFNEAKTEIEKLDFSNVKTIETIHKGQPLALCYNAGQFVETEKEAYINATYDPDYIEIRVSSKTLLEVYNNVREISEAGT